MYGSVMVDLEGTELLPIEETILQHPHVGGVILFTRNYQNKAQLKALVKAIRSKAQKPILITVDHEGGRVWRFREGFTVLGPMREIGVVFDRDQDEALQWAEECGQVMASELLDCGIDLSFAPVLDLDQGLSEVIGDRAFHSDPHIIAQIARAFISGMQQAGMQAVGKHFPGHGSCVLDSHIACPVDDRPLEIMWREDIYPFQQLAPILGGIMPSHVIYPEVDSLPTGFSKRWLQDILRDQLGFKGAIMSDCLSMKGAHTMGTPLERVQKALEAGCDMVIFCQEKRPDLLTLLERLDYKVPEISAIRLAQLVGQIQTSSVLFS